MKYFVITLLFSVLSLNAAASIDSNYTLVSRQGKPYFYNEAKKSWSALSKDDTILHTSKVRLSYGNYLLIKSDLGFLEFNIAGTYNLAEYDGRLKKFDDLALKYQQIAVDSLLAKSSRKETFYGQDLLDIQTDKDLLSIYPSPTYTYGNTIDLKWRPMNDNIYIIKMYHSEQSMYYYRELKGDQINIDMANLRLPTDRCIYWTVTVKGSEYSSKPKCIYILNIGEASNIELPAFQLENQLNFKMSSIHHLMMALYYEEHKIMFKAEEHYKLAFDLSNHADRYKQLYYNFLERRNTLIID